MNGTNEMKSVQYFTAIPSHMQDVSIISKSFEDLIMASMDRDFGDKGFTNKFSVDNYDELNNKVKNSVISYCSAVSNIPVPKTASELLMAFDNSSSFTSIFNTITVHALRGVLLRTVSRQIENLASVDVVGLGESITWEIEPKGLPIAQRSSYNSNVAFLESYAISSITAKPKSYTTGLKISVTRMLSNGYDIGAAFARVAMSIRYAEFKLVTDMLFNTVPLANTPFYLPSYSPAKYIELATDLGALNGERVKAYGTRVAYNAVGAISTTNFGFETQDEMIRNGFLGHAYGIENIALEQFTDLSAPFNTLNAPALRGVPNDKILLISDTGDKPVRLVREDYIRVNMISAKDTSTNEIQFSYSAAFDAALATPAHMGIVAAKA